MKNKFAFITDIIFLSFVTFTLSLVAFNFFIPHPYSIIYSACVALLFAIFFYARSDKRRTEERESNVEKKELSALMSELNFSTKAEQNEIIENALKKAKVEFDKKRGIILLKDKNALLLCRFSFNKITKADVVRAYNLIGRTQKAYILAENFDPDVASFADRFEKRVILVNGDKVFSFLKDNDALPKEYKYIDFFEKKSKASLRTLLDKKKAKTFFVFGLLFLLFSYISPLKLYYIICGCLFLIYSLILRLFGKEINLVAVQADNI